MTLPIAAQGGAQARAWLQLWATRPRFLALAAFLFAGDLKADPRLAWVPVDLTLATGAFLVGVLALRVARGVRPTSAWILGLLCAWWLTFLPGVAGAVASPYTFQKVGTLFTFSLLAALAPLWLLEAPGDLRRLVNAMAYFCFAITLGGLLAAGDGAQARLQAFGAGTISLGRATGLLFLLAALTLEDGPDGLLRIPTFGLMALAGITALYSGSRGPIVAALLGLGLLSVLGRQRLGRRALGRLVTGVALAAVVAASLSLAPSGSAHRVEAFFRGQYGGSERYRVQALEGAWDLIPGAPAGLGWGRFATRVDLEKGLDRQYPHNLIAEVTLEGGWLCGAATLLVLLTALLAAWSRTGRPEGRLALAGLVFYGVNALVSGDVNDNRPLFMWVTAALALLEAGR